MPLQFDPAYKAAIEPMLQAMGGSLPKFPSGDVAGVRTFLDAVFGPPVAGVPYPPDVEQKEYHTTAPDGHKISITHFHKRTETQEPGPVPAVLYLHPGGLVWGSVATFANVTALTTSLSGVAQFSVDYRLAPEVKDTTPVEDCYAALVWLRDHAAELNVDAKRIAVRGESAGGGLAAGVALMARDRKLDPPLAKQILIYPMLDDRTGTTFRDEELEPFLSISYDDNITCWRALLGEEKAGKADDGSPVSPYAVPARAQDLRGLPPTYIDVGELDVFREEDKAFAEGIRAAGGECELHVYDGVPHAWEPSAPQIEVTKRAGENRLRAMMSF